MTISKIRKTIGLISLTVMLSLFISAGVTHAASPTINEYTLPAATRSSSESPEQIVTGPDGSEWITENANGSIAKMTSSGTVTTYLLASGRHPTGITLGPDGALWFVEVSGTSDYIGRLTTAGQLTEYPITVQSPYTGSWGDNITTGPDGALWFTINGESVNTSFIGRITTSGVITEYPITGDEPTIGGITAGPDGNLWFVEADDDGNNIGSITTTGTITLHTLPSVWQSVSSPTSGYITKGSDGKLWFTYGNNNRIGSITTSGTVSTFATPTTTANPQAITPGSDGSLWFTEENASKIGDITTSGSFQEYTIPTANSLPMGITSSSDGSLWFDEYGSNKIGHLIPNIAPSPPQNLTAPSPTNLAPSLTWTASTTASSYNVYRNGVKVGSSTTASFTDTSLPSDGTYSYYVTAVNASGESSSSNTISVLADTTPPTITYTVTPVADSNNYNTGNVLVTFHCSDTGSGVASCTSPVTVPNEGVGQQVTGMSTDNAGNTATVQVNPSLLVSAVNAGGSTVGAYSADNGFNGGTTYSTTTAVNTSNTNDPAAPQSVYQTVRYGNTFSYTFSNLTPNANYTLMMHFNELYWGTSLADGGGVGSRVFNVAVNGQSTLNNFDIYNTAGAANTAVVQQVPATADSNGDVTITFTSDTDNAMVSGLALYNGTLPTESPNPIQQPTTSVMIDAGGTGSGSFAADTDYLGGSTYTTTSSIDTSNILTNPAPQEVYQSDRYGNFTYTIPNLTPNTSYNIQLDFAEPYWGINGNGGTGSREFDVSMNGTQVLNDFDVYTTAGGADKALAEDFTTTSDANGNIAITFNSVIDNAMVSGIEVTETN